MIKDSFTTKEAAALAGFRTGMMVDYLCRQGIVVPSKRPGPGRGRARLYSFGDLVLLRAVSRLLQSGLPVRRLKDALEKLRKQFQRVRPETAIAKYLITDGKEVFLVDRPEALLNLNRDGQLAFAFIIDVEHAREDVIAAAASASR
jgi:DNA-binding transcriptional MerR regulator